MLFEDTIYGAPWKGSFIWVLFTNDDLFEAAGLDPSGDAPTTWDELVEVSKNLTDESAGQSQLNGPITVLISAPTGATVVTP